MINMRNKYVRKFIFTEEKDCIRVFLNISPHFRQLILISFVKFVVVNHKFDRKMSTIKKLKHIWQQWKSCVITEK